MFCSLRRAVACASVLAFAAAVPATAQQPVHIRSSGPLTDIALGPTLARSPSQATACTGIPTSSSANAGRS